MVVRCDSSTYIPVEYKGLNSAKLFLCNLQREEEEKEEEEKEEEEEEN